MNQLKSGKKIAESYYNYLQGIAGIKCIRSNPDVSHNYSYFPILVDEIEYGMSRDTLYEKLKMYNIYGRRYFYPLISNFTAYRGLPSSNPSNLAIAEKVAKQVICLPIYPDMEEDRKISEITSVIAYVK